MSNRGKTKKKTVNKSPKNIYNSDEIILEISNLRNSYIQYDSKDDKLMPVDYNNDSKIPFNRIIYMIKNSEDLETRGKMPYYVFPYVLDTYLTDVKFLKDENISPKIIKQFDTLYINIIIECIREYLKNPKYETEIIVHFWDTIQKLCNNRDIIKRILYLLKINQDSLFKKKEFLTLCDEKILTQSQIQPIITGTRITNNHNHNHSSYAHASELPRPVLVEEEAPDYYDPRTREPIYINPITWNEDIHDLLPKRSRSRGGKRKTKKSIKIK